MLLPRHRRWLIFTVALAAIALLIPAALWLAYRHSLRGRFDRVEAGMTEAEVVAIMGQVNDDRSKPWPPQVSQHAEVWRVQDGAFVRREYHGMDVHTQVGLVGNSYSVWRADDGVVIVEYDATGRVCGKVRLTA